jgi:hypothetical protein
METTQQKLDRIAKLGDQLTQWEQGFTESVADQYKRRNLSDGQHAVIDKILAKYNPDAIKARNDWRANYDDEKREIARKVAEYYKKNPPYYGDVATKILNDPAYIPSEKCFNKMTGNKYAQRALAAAATPPVFSKGQLVRFRRNDEVRNNHVSYTGKPGGRTYLTGKLAVVLSISDTPGAAKGSRGYTVLPMGATKPIETLERRLMRSKTA